MKSEIAWLLSPKYGHIIPSLNFIKAVTERFGRVDVYTDNEVGRRIVGDVPFANVHYLESWKDDFAELADKPFIRIFPKLIASQGEMLRELESIWSGGHRPKLIIADFLILSAAIYASKYQIPLVRVYPTYILNNAELRRELTRDYLRRAFTQFTVFSDAIHYVHSKLSFSKHLAGKDLGRRTRTLDIAFLPSFLAPNKLASTEHHVGPSLRTSKLQVFDRFDPSLIAPGKKIVYIAIGTLKVSIRFFENCLRAFTGTDYTVVIVCRPPYDRQLRIPIPDNCHLAHYAPQMEILKRAALFITHCGMNGFLEGMYNRVPMIAWPLDSDGWMTANRMEQMNVGRELKSDKPENIQRLAIEVMDDQGIKTSLDAYAAGSRVRSR